MGKSKRTGLDIEREIYWQEYWKANNVYAYDEKSKEESFTIDTPPPTVSGKLHLGHVFSYSQTEVIARFQRMNGKNVLYPFGLDDNGLPTERLIEKEHNVKGHQMDTQEFIKLVYDSLPKYHQQYKTLFERLGFSYDWDKTYSTISAEIQKETQKTFIELYKKGLVYQKKSPALYCWECKTSVAQAEVEDKIIAGKFYDLKFKKDNGETLIIATTRPELLPACVAVFVHPEDKRYADLVGQKVITPLGKKVKVYEDDKVEIDKGSGAVMVCSYGDETDLYWIRTYNLPERIIFDENGKFTENCGIKELEGKALKEVREVILEILKNQGDILSSKEIEHAVGVHERCSTPIEIYPTDQWFVKALDYKEDLIEVGRKINWYPSFMKGRYENWVENLKWDWCISRERFYGIPIPIMKCISCGEVFYPKEKDLPFDPRTESERHSCPHCNSDKVVGSDKVFDTWFTSARTPEINGHWPMNFRPQAHDIIRTWAFYSILMGVLKHDNTKPWNDIVISGHVLAKKGSKISKRTGGGAYDPMTLIDENSADAIRYAMYGASLGKDGYFEEDRVEAGKKLVKKLLNSCKFVLMNIQSEPNALLKTTPDLEPIDKWILLKVKELAENMKNLLNEYDYMKSLLLFEEFYWNIFCDNYLEIAKGRLYNDCGEKTLSAKYTLYQVQLAVLKMIAPFMPHIAEELYHAILEDRTLESEPGKGKFRSVENIESIHRSNWPCISLESQENIVSGGDLVVEIIDLMRAEKERMNISLGKDVQEIVVSLNQSDRKKIATFKEDLKMVSRANNIDFLESANRSVQLKI